MATVTSESDEPIDQEWNKFRPLITKLYETQPLRDVRDHLKRHHDFHASEHAFKRRLHAWRVDKNTSAVDMERILQILMQTKRRELMQRSTDQELVVDGHKIKLSQVKRYMRRKKTREADTGHADHRETSDPQSRADYNDCGSGAESPSSAVDSMASISSLLESAQDNTDLCQSSVSNADNGARPDCSGLLEAIPEVGAFEENRNIRPSKRAFTDCDNDQDNHDDESYGSGPKRLRRTDSPASVLEDRLLSCPYSKHDPVRYSEKNTVEMNYRGCSGCYLRDISRLKQHLFRVHQRPQYYCDRCYSTSEDLDDLRNHRLRQPPCETAQVPFPERITEDQSRALKKKMFGQTPQDTWFRIWDILFPGVTRPLSPYRDNPSPTTTQDFLRYFERQAPSILAASIRDRLHITSADSSHFIVEALTEAVVDTVRIVAAHASAGRALPDANSTPHIITRRQTEYPSTRRPDGIGVPKLPYSHSRWERSYPGYDMYRPTNPLGRQIARAPAPAPAPAPASLFSPTWLYDPREYPSSPPSEMGSNNLSPHRPSFPDEPFRWTDTTSEWLNLPNPIHTRRMSLPLLDVAESTGFPVVTDGILEPFRYYETHS